MIKALDKPLEEIPMPTVKGKGRYKKQQVLDTVNCFDTETTNFYIGMSGIPQPYDYNNAKMEEQNGVKRNGKPKMQRMKKGALVWIWQCSIEGNKFYGRTLEEFKSFLEVWNGLCPDLKIMYIHNADFDVTFLLNLFDVKEKNVFAARSHAPLYVHIPEVNLEIRDSAELTHMSLETWGEEIGLPKMVGDLDYDVIRTPLTPIDESSKEFGYCIRDIEVMDKGLRKYREKYDHVYNIPLTQTGELRRKLNEVFKPCKSYMAKCHKAFPRSLDVYNFLDLAFWGGVVLCNPIYRGETLTQHIQMYDIASSYPWALISEKYPVNPLSLVEREEDYQRYLDDSRYGCFLEIEVEGCQTRTECLEMSTSHIYGVDKDTPPEDVTSVNGRLVSAKKFRSTMFETDFKLLKRFYDCKKITITKMMVSKLEYLPAEFRLFIIDLYKNKTSYKDVEGKEAIYAISKMFINACYGVFVQRLLRGATKFNAKNIEWTNEDLDEALFEAKLQEVLYTKSGRNKDIYITPQIGIAVTAYARRNLFEAYGWDGEDFTLDSWIVYTDTDSVKYIDNPLIKPVINRYNENVFEKHRQIAKQLGIDPEELSPKAPNGKSKPIGIFADDGETNEWRSLGSKKYIYRSTEPDKETGEKKLKMTLAGVPKDQVELLDDDILNFDENFEFSVDAARAAGIKNKLTPYYLYDMEPVTFPDGWVHNYKYGVCLMPTPYKLGLGDDLCPTVEEFNNIISFYNDNSAIRNNMKIKRR